MEVEREKTKERKKEEKVGDMLSFFMKACPLWETIMGMEPINLVHPFFMVDPEKKNLKLNNGFDGVVATVYLSVNVKQ